MKKYIYSYFNVLGGFYGDPFTADVTPSEFPDAYKIALFNAPEEELIKIKAVDVICLGELDNITGVITPCHEFILHCEEIASIVFAARFKKEEVEEGD